MPPPESKPSPTLLTILRIVPDLWRFIPPEQHGIVAMVSRDSRAAYFETIYFRFIHRRKIPPISFAPWWRDGDGALELIVTQRAPVDLIMRNLLRVVRVKNGMTGSGRMLQSVILEESWLAAQLKQLAVSEQLEYVRLLVDCKKKDRNSSPYSAFMIHSSIEIMEIISERAPRWLLRRWLKLLNTDSANIATLIHLAIKSPLLRRLLRFWEAAIEGQIGKKGYVLSYDIAHALHKKGGDVLVQRVRKILECLAVSGLRHVNERGDVFWTVEGQPNGTAYEWEFHRTYHDATYAGLLLHRDDGPAIEWADGDSRWINHGKLHREGGLPAVEYGNAAAAWLDRGTLGRLVSHQPANERGAWYIHGLKVTEAQAQAWWSKKKALALRAIRRWLVPILYNPANKYGQRRMEMSWLESEALMNS